MPLGRSLVKIMVVDDSRAMRLIVRRTLRQAGFEGHEVAEAVNGSDALAKFHDVSPELILCDWNMPEMTGLEVLQALRSRGAQVNFGFVTSEATDQMREKAREAGAQFLIAKPFTPDQFRMVLKDYVH